MIDIHFLIFRFIALALAISLHFSCEVFAEKDQQIIEEEIPIKKQAKSLGVGDSILKDIGFDIEADSLSEKIKTLLFSQVQLDEVLKLIVDLDDEDFRVRNEASKKLAMHESPIGHLLVNLNQDLSVEMSRRVQAILNVRAKKRFTDVLYHALESELLDFTKLDLDSLLVTSSTFSPKVYSRLLRVIENAAVRCAAKNDIPKLIQELENDSLSRRQVSAFVLGFFGENIEKKEPLIRLANIRGQLCSSTKSSPNPLIDLLDSEDLNVRHEAGVILRSIFNKDYGYAAYDSFDQRNDAILKWRKLMKEDDTDFSAGSWSESIFSEDYRVIVGKRLGKGGNYNLFTTSGKPAEMNALTSSLSGYSNDQLTVDNFSGHVVVSGGAKHSGSISVFSTKGHQLWSVNGIAVDSGAAMLANGQIISTSGSTASVMDMLGQTIKTWEFSSSVSSFHGLSQNRFLCAHTDAGMIAEYNANGELIWSLDGLNKPRNVSRYDNGNLSVVLDIEKKNSNGDETVAEVELVELSPDGGSIVSSIQPRGVKSITASAKLPNGNTLVGTEKGLAEYTPSGYAIKVWLKNPITVLHVQ